MAQEDASRGQARLPQDADFFRRLLDSLQHPFYVIDVRDYSVVFANGMAGGDPQATGSACYRLIHGRSRPCDGDNPCPLEELRATGRATRTEHTHYDDRGRPYPAAVHGTPVFDDSGELAYMVAYSRDLSERKHLEEDLSQAAAVFHHASEGIMITDAFGRIERVNDAFSHITGYTPEEAVGRKPGDLLGSGWQGPGFYRDLWRQLIEEGEWQGEIWNRRKDGGVFPERLTISRVRDHLGQTSHYIGIFSDITEKKEEESHLRRLAYFDPLTGLPNRATLEDRLEQALARVGRGQSHIALLFLDLDGFKGVNDRWGHKAGDALLREAATRLERSLRRTDTVARMGGDEFVVLMEGSGNCQAEVVADKLLAAFAEPFSLPSGDSVPIGLSIGILGCTAGEDQPEDPERLIQLADRAMYAAKAAGRNTYRYAEPLTGGGRDRSSLKPAALRTGLAANELMLFYQPQVDLTANRLSGMEALMRWQHPERGLLRPGDFLDEAKAEGELGSLGEWALAEACRQQRQWQAAGGSPVPVAVNVAAAQWRDPGTLLKSVDRVLGETGLEPHLLELEVPEAVLSKDSPRNRRSLHSLGDMGVRVTIDDFGSGGTPLGFLHMPALTKLKLDPAFLAPSLEAGSGNHPPELLETTYTLAASLGLEVVAKGVETRAQCEHLLRRGHRQAQGFFLAEPKPADALEPSVRSGLLRVAG